MILFHAIFAVAFTGAGLLVYVVLGTVPWEESGLAQEMVLAIRYGAPGVFLLVGALSIVSFVRSWMAISDNREMANELLERGVEATGEITYIDKNWSIQINNRPIYSIIEYAFEVNGQTYTRRKDNAPTETVIRSGLAVGHSVPIYYLPEDPDKNMLLIGTEEQLNELRAQSVGKRKRKR